MMRPARSAFDPAQSPTALRPAHSRRSVVRAAAALSRARQRIAE